MDVQEPDQLQQTGDMSILYVGSKSTALEGLEAGNHLDVTAARTPTDADAPLESNGVDCVVSQHDLPGSDGVEFLGHVRERRPELPLFLLTEEADEDVVEAAVDAGVTDCLDRSRLAGGGKLLARRVRDATAARRVAADELLRDTERLARTGGWCLELASGDLQVTPGCRRLHGLRETPSGMDALISRFHPDDQQTLRTALVRAKETTDEVLVFTNGATIETVPTGEKSGGEVYLPELRLRPENTPDRTVEVRMESVTSDGEVVAINGAVSDATDRSRYEQEVRRYEQVADSLPVGLFRATVDGEFASVNRTLVSILGADSKVDLHDTRADELVVSVEGEGEGVEPERFCDLFDVDETAEMHRLRIETLDGETRWVDVTLSPAERDGVEYVDGVVQDVTERRRRNRQIERSERRYRTLAENLPNGAVFVFDTDLRYRYVHGEIFGTVEEGPGYYEGKQISDVFEGETLETVREVYEATLEGERRRTEMDFAGLTYEVNTVPVRDENDTVYAGIVMTQDVTDRVERERRLARVRDRMQFALEATDSYVYEIDLETGEETRHGPFERIHGVDPAAVPTSEAFYERCVHPEDRERIRELQSVENLADHSGTVTGEYRTERADGDVRWLYTQAYLRTRPEGDPERLIGLTLDITERKHREEELQRRNERLDQFASVVSHDLRSPLNIASAHLEILREEHDSEHLERALDAIDRGHALVADLLTLSRDIETVEDSDTVSLATVVEQAWRDGGSTGATLVTETTGTVRADRGLLRQLLTNLLRNAVEHASTEDRSQSDDPGVTVTVGDIADDGFYVADDGPGIPPADRDDIFESGYSTSQENAGQGLAIVHEIASAHGWEVTVTESDDGGARFEITGVETIATDTGGVEDRLGQIDGQARDIYETIEREPRSIPELTAECDLSPPVVCRRLELLKRHELVDDRTRVGEDGNTYSVYGAATNRRERE